MRASFSASARKRDRDGETGSEETGKRGNGETRKRWGLLERSPQTPQELSRYISDWNRRSCPVPDLSCSIHGGCDFGCCRIGLAASAGIGKSGMPPDIGTSAPAGIHPGKSPAGCGFRPLFRCPAGQAPRRATPRQVQPAPPGFSPLHADFAPCSGAPLGKPPVGQRQRRFSPCRPGSAPGMQGAKPLA